MVELTKPVRRLTQVQVRNGKHRGRKIIVIMEPPNTLTYRIKGTRQQYSISFEQGYDMAMKNHAIEIWNRKMADYKASKRRTKPRKPVFY